MSDDSKAFEQFGKEFIEHARDFSISQSMIPVNRAANGTAWYKLDHELAEILGELTSDKQELLKKLIIQTVDTTIHSVLFFFEDSGIAKIHLKTDEEDIPDIRSAAAGDLQGYIFIWGEKYSSELMSG